MAPGCGILDCRGLRAGCHTGGGSRYAALPGLETEAGGLGCVSGLVGRRSDAAGLAGVAAGRPRKLQTAESGASRVVVCYAMRYLAGRRRRNPYRRRRIRPTLISRFSGCGASQPAQLRAFGAMAES